jgi:hypothetical protein
MTLLRNSPGFLSAFALSICVWQASACAAQQPSPEQDAAQQVALQAQRAQVLSRYQTERATCMHQFFVNACLDASRKQERSALAPIDADLQAIALRARMRAAERALRQVQANIAAAQATQPDRAQARSESAQRDAALAQREKQAAERARQAASATKATGPSSTAPGAVPAVPRLSRERRADPSFLGPHGVRVGEPTQGALFPAPVSRPVLTPAQRAAESARAQADYAAKQKAYAEKQAEQARRNAAQPQAAPLPVPSPSAALR